MQIRSCLYAVIILHFLLTFLWESWIFTGIPIESVLSYMMIKCCTLAVIAGFWKLIFTSIMKKNSLARRILLYGFPYALLLLLVFVYRIPSSYFSSDEEAIFSQALEFDLFARHFMYPTGLVTAVGLQLFPSISGPAIFHILLQAFVCGYCIARLDNKWLYLLFLFFPCLTYSYSIHRMQSYGLLYGWLFVKCYTDYKENELFSLKNFIIVTGICAVLSFWRREGVYMLALMPFILCGTYHMSWNFAKKYILLAYVLAAMIIAPEFIHDNMLSTAESVEPEADVTYVAFFTQMKRLGLDMEKYPEWKEKTVAFMDMEMLDKLNDTLGSRMNRDMYLNWDVLQFANYCKDNFPDMTIPEELFDGRSMVAIRDNLTDKDSQAFRQVVKTLVVNEPLIFIKTRLSVFHYASVDNIFLSNRQGFAYWRRAIFTNLYFPLLCIVLAGIIAVWKKKWQSPLLVFTGGILLHTLITTLAAPCGYFKYYYHVYMIGWIIFFIWLADFIRKRKGVHNV